MGSGRYDYLASSTRSATVYANATREQTFTNRSLDPLMDPKRKLNRESRDGDEHPDSYPIIIALDVTGSMSRIPHDLIKGVFPEVMKKIIEAGVKEPQVCFCAIGDHECDRAPFQLGEFETSDELMEKWLKATYLEGGGGGNAGESYLLAWYFASRHTSCDAFEKRGKKGCLITIGDEPTLKSLPKSAIQDIFGENIQGTEVLASQLLEEVKDKWNVFHINVTDYSGNQRRVKESWTDYMGENLINTESPYGKDIETIIPGLVLQSYNGEVSPSVSAGD